MIVELIINTLPISVKPFRIDINICEESSGKISIAI